MHFMFYVCLECGYTGMVKVFHRFGLSITNPIDPTHGFKLHDGFPVCTPLMITMKHDGNTEIIDWYLFIYYLLLIL